MEKLSEVLKKLQENDMCVYEITIEGNPRLKDVPIVWLSHSTHYILKGDELMHVGNKATIERFALSL